MNAEIVIQKLRSIGYKIQTDGQDILLNADRDPDHQLATLLIAELKLRKAEVINILKAGKNIPAATIKEYGTSATGIWVNPYPQGTTEARQETLLQCLDATWQASYDRVASAWPGGKISQEIINAGREVDRVYALIRSGRGELDDFIFAAEAWERACFNGSNTTRDNDKKFP